MAPHSSTRAWKIPRTEELGGLQSMGSLRVRHDWETLLSRIGKGNSNPLQCSCLENPSDGRAWWAAVYRDAQSRTRLKWLSSSGSRLQQYVIQELSDVQVGFRKGRRTRDQIANTHWIIEKATEFQKQMYFCFLDYTKAFDCVDHNKLLKILKQVGIWDHLICLLRNLYGGQEATVRTRHE